MHPTLITSKAHQWPLSDYIALMQSLPKDQFQWIVTGVESDRAYLQPLLDLDCINTVGQLTLDELITFMTACDGIVAGSTGPLHLAAALGLHALGLYQSNPEVYQRWAPLGQHAEVLHSTIPCQGERKLATCPCILAIPPEQVKAIILTWFDAK